MRYEKWSINRTIRFPPRSYNPSVIMPESLWRKIYNNSLLTLKGLIVLGWRTRSLKEFALFNSIFVRDNKLVDINSLLRWEQKKRVHVKFVGRESDEVSRIYEEHLRLGTTISNFMLSLALRGMYTYVETVAYYGGYTPDVTKVALEDAYFLKDFLRRFLEERVRREGVESLAKSVLDKANLLNSRIRTKLMKIDYGNIENFVNGIVDAIFSVRPRIVCKMYLGMYTPLGAYYVC